MIQNLFISFNCQHLQLDLWTCTYDVCTKHKVLFVKFKVDIGKDIGEHDDAIEFLPLSNHLKLSSSTRQSHQLIISGCDIFHLCLWMVMYKYGAVHLIQGTIRAGCCAQLYLGHNERDFLLALHVYYRSIYIVGRAEVMLGSVLVYKWHTLVSLYKQLVCYLKFL